MDSSSEPGPGPSDSAKLSTRRWILLVAVAGFGSGWFARHVIQSLESPSDGTLRGIPMAGPVLPMEEEPLPHDVHLASAHAASPPTPEPAAVSDAAGRPDPLLDAPHPTPLPSIAALETPPASPAPTAEALPTVAKALPEPVRQQPAHSAAPAAAAPVGGAAWLRNARPYVDTKGMPAVAIVIDDLGLGAAFTRRAIALDSAVTLALMTYATKLDDWSGAARAARHELLVHVPMQPLNVRIDPGPKALTVSLSDVEILDRLRWGLDRMDGYVGINNHMGSRFTQDRAGMSVVMAELKTRGLLFLDSVTIGGTVGPTTAAALHVPAAERNVFLDDVASVAGVSRQIAVLEQVARRHGSAIAIGHPHEATLSVLAQWLPTVASRGITVVPLTSVVRRQMANA